MRIDVAAALLSFDEAVAWFTRRTIIDEAKRRDIIGRARARSWWIAHVAQASVVQSVFDDITKALKSGQGFQLWRKEAKQKLDKAWSLRGGASARRVELIWRNASQQAYSRGRYEQMAAPAVKKMRPYWMYDAVMDSRVSDLCSGLNGTILGADDPFWDTHTPPLHHACRSGIRSLRRSVAERKGISQSPPAETAQDGFGYAPDKLPDPGAGHEAQALDPEVAGVMNWRAKHLPPDIHAAPKDIGRQAEQARGSDEREHGETTAAAIREIDRSTRADGSLDVSRNDAGSAKQLPKRLAAALDDLDLGLLWATKGHGLSKVDAAEVKADELVIVGEPTAAKTAKRLRDGLKPIRGIRHNGKIYTDGDPNDAAAQVYYQREDVRGNGKVRVDIIDLDKHKQTPQAEPINDLSEVIGKLAKARGNLPEIRDVISGYLRAAGLHSRDRALLLPEARAAKAVEFEYLADADHNSTTGAVRVGHEVVANLNSALDKLAHSRGGKSALLSLSDREASAIKALVHEELHGHSPASEHGGQAIMVEEGSTEIVARRMVRRLFDVEEHDLPRGHFLRGDGGGPDSYEASYQQHIDALWKHTERGTGLSRAESWIELEHALTVLRGPKYRGRWLRTEEYLRELAKTLEVSDVEKWVDEAMKEAAHLVLR